LDALDESYNKCWRMMTFSTSLPSWYVSILIGVLIIKS
jgi:hypothetical protein